MRDADSQNRRVLIESRRTEEQGVEVIVQDTGPGISAELRDQAFQQFFTSKQGGLGIGLAISRSIIESHKGTIWFASPVGDGARVQFRLPPEKLEVNHV
jgi:signal transduction histidine kinase